ncbi:MAG: universal stress protein UspA [Legionellales bacterium RIFCSPHIGHO2_12_FULL_37_14]|nr:MAG: universal stress protein UspA [Legionellales bacterium RIFCSPHIGHO2_12_FULL_37_14]
MYKRILHATDLQKNHFAMCEKANTLAKYHHAELFLVHIVEIPQSMILAQNLGFAGLIAPAKEDAKIVLKTVGEALKIPTSHQFVDTGIVRQHILERATSLKCDLIILGRHGEGMLQSLLGSTTYHIMQHAECDVLTLK